MRPTGQLFFLFLLISFSSFSQVIDGINYHEKYKLQSRKTTELIKVDGILDEAIWSSLPVAENFWNNYPNDTDPALRKTKVRVTFDEHFLYIAAELFDSTARSIPFVASTLKRDTRYLQGDAFAVTIDPVNKRTNGFYFSVNPYNVQSEALITAASGHQHNPNWDNKWVSATQQLEDRWTVEMAIPFKSLRYNPGQKTWGINFTRIDGKSSNTATTWTKVPANFASYDFGYTGVLDWETAPPKQGSNISIIPYVMAGLNKDAGEKIQTNFDPGFDAKVAVSSSLNLDLTVNPDFSQVEVDRQVNNLTRFNIFFPERRNFFLENSDIFSEFGTPFVRPFYSRRIGLDAEARAVPILFGARLTGNLSQRTRIGLMSMQTQRTDNFASQNYTAVSVHQQVLKRSLLTGYFLNREGFYNDDNKPANPIDKYGRNAGTEFTYSSEDGKWKSWAALQLSFKEGIKKDNSAFTAGTGYFGRNISTFIGYDDNKANYYADMGFLLRTENYDALRDTIVRLGYKQLVNDFSYIIYPKKGIVNVHTLHSLAAFFLNANGTLNERNNTLSYQAIFKNTSVVYAEFVNQHVNLPFAIAFTDKDPLPAVSYHFSNAAITYTTDTRKNLSLQGGARIGKFYSGDYQQFTGGIIFRRQPYFTFELNAEYNRLSFPEPYGKTDLFLLAPRIEINFSNSLFWTTFLQYNTQANNFNINSRLQWRYKPVSDIFLVYTDNYFVDPRFSNKNRAVVLKVNYWLNL